MTRTRGPGQRAGLSREAVVAAAVGLATERGAAAVTMRAVAARLDVAPNALYSHVDGKTGLLDAVLDDLLRSVEPPPGPDPRTRLHGLMTRSYEVLLERPDLVPLYLARQGTRGPQADRLGGAMTELLGALSVTGPAARDAVRVLIVYTMGFAAVSAAPSAGALSHGVPLSADEAGRSFADGLGWLIDGIAPDS